MHTQITHMFTLKKAIKGIEALLQFGYTVLSSMVESVFVKKGKELIKIQNWKETDYTCSMSL